MLHSGITLSCDVTAATLLLLLLMFFAALCLDMELQCPL
jgi:hypothetical protein